MKYVSPWYNWNVKNWALKKQLPSYLYLPHLSSPHAIRNNPFRGRRTHPQFSSDRKKHNTFYLPIRWNMFRPDITETVDWALKKQLPSYLYLYLSHLSSPHAIRNNPFRGRWTHPRFSSDREKNTNTFYLPIRWIMFRPDITETLKTERWKSNYLPTYTYLTFHRHTQSGTILSEEEERIRGFQATGW